jgi:hypothetical protein
LRPPRERRRTSKGFDDLPFEFLGVSRGSERFAELVADKLERRGAERRYNGEKFDLVKAAPEPAADDGEVLFERASCLQI